MTYLQTARSNYSGKGKGKGKGKEKESTDKGEGVGESSAQGRGPSSAGTQPADPDLPSLEVIPLGERVPDQVLADLKARAEACKARLAAGKKGVVPDPKPPATPDMP
ncbi:MAG: hypothetical protein AB2570_20655, partial [Candidatus Thiodiazotropha endolucinida]